MSVIDPKKRAFRWLAAAALTLGIAPTNVAAEETAPIEISETEKKACVEASVVGQSQRTDGKLGKARESFLRCAQASCPSLLRKECDGWFHEVELAIPTIIASARDPAGSDLTDVRLSVDGVVLASKLDGRAIALDPGVHELVFTSPGREPVHQSVVLAEGELRRAVRVVMLPSTSEDGPHVPSPSPSIAPWLLVGVSVVALGSFTYFGLEGGSKMRSFSDCKPECDPSDVSSARKKLLVADISLGVAVASAGLAVVLFTSSRGESKPATSIGLAPIPGGGIAGFAGAF